jgi:hypothetical protein
MFTILLRKRDVIMRLFNDLMRLAICGYAAQTCGEAEPLREMPHFFLCGYAACDGAAFGKIK